MITLLPVGGFWTAAPVTFLSDAPTEYLRGTSLKGGVSPPLYRGDGFFVLPPVWTDTEIDTLASMWAELPIRLDLSDEETNALIARINSNVVSTPSTE